MIRKRIIFLRWGVQRREEKRLASNSKIDLWLNRLISISPLLWMVGFFALVARVASEVGHVPYYAHPDPKDIEFDLHYFFLWIGFYFLFFLILSKLVSFYLKNWPLLVLTSYSFFVAFVLILSFDELGGLLILYLSLAFVGFSIWVVGHIFIKRMFDGSHLTLACSLFLLWGHLLLDPWGLRDWFLD